MRRLAPACVVVLLWLLAAAPAQSATYWVQVNGIFFFTYNNVGTLVAAPAGDPTVDPGDTIFWEWGPSGGHDVVSGNLNTGVPDGKFNTNGIRGNGATFTYTTAAAAASYTYFCTPHRSSGMKGTIKATGTTNEPPVAMLTATPAQPLPGQTITLDGTASSDPEANLLAKYRWDLDGNGTFETSTTTPTTTTTYAAGNHVVSLRVIDGKSALGDTTQTLTVQFPKPLSVTGAATNVTQTTATVEGSVHPKGTSTSYTFEFGPTTDYGSSTPPVDVAQGSADTPASASLANLTPGTLYHYRLVATNSGGTTTGSDATFTTAAPPTPVALTPTSKAPDTSPPVVAVSSAASQSIATGVLSLTVTPKEATELTLSGRITIRGAKAILVKARPVAAPAGKPAKLVLRLSKKTRALVRAALARGKKVRATLTLKARDGAGNVTTKTAIVRLRQPSR
jgi:plastocyanin